MSRRDSPPPRLRSSNTSISTRRNMDDADTVRTSGATSEASDLPTPMQFIVLLFLTWPPRIADARALLASSLVGEMTTVATFFEDTTVFVLSRLWFDLWSNAIFQLHPTLYCENYLELACTTEAPASSQYIFALASVPIGGFGKHMAEWTGLADRWRGFHQLPMMLKYTTGWAFAFATDKFLREVKAAHPGLCAMTLRGEACVFNANHSAALVPEVEPDCTGLEIGFASLLTVTSAFVLLKIQPWAQNIEWGDGRCIDFVEDLVSDLWSMVARGCTITVMSAWYYASYRTVLVGADGPLLTTKLLLLWAGVSTFAGAMFSAALELMEIRIKSSSPKLAAGHRDLVVEAACSFSDLVQAAMSWVAGCAWLDVAIVIFPTLSEAMPPDIDVLAINVLLALAAAAFAVAWFVVTGEPVYGGDDIASRATVERFFVSNSFSFFVGWVWLVVARNGVGMLRRLEERAGLRGNLEGSTGPLIVLLSFWLLFGIQHRLVDNLTERVSSIETMYGLSSRRTTARGMHRGTEYDMEVMEVIAEEKEGEQTQRSSPANEGGSPWARARVRVRDEVERRRGRQRRQRRGDIL